MVTPFQLLCIAVVLLGIGNIGTLCALNALRKAWRSALRDQHSVNKSLLDVGLRNFKLIGLVIDRMKGEEPNA